MLRLVQISFSDVQFLLQIQRHIVVIYDTSFCNYHISAYEQNNSLDYVYHVTVNNSTEEDYLISTLRVSTVPVVVAYCNSCVYSVQYNTNVNSIISSFEKMIRESENIVLEPKYVDCDYSMSYQNFGMLYISGDKSAVGKSTTCLALLASLLAIKIPDKHGDSVSLFKPEDLAYIKPATQCEADTTVAKYCRLMSIECIPIGPVVYYKGFTRSFLNGTSEYTQSEYIQQIVEVMDNLKKNKKLVIVDGVGYPSVGSICQLSNADICSSLQNPCNYLISNNTGIELTPVKVPAPVLLIGKSGVGDAIDSYNLNEAYFHTYKLTVLGGIFNKFSTNPDDYYNLYNCKESISQYFRHRKYETNRHYKGIGSYPNLYGLFPLITDFNRHTGQQDIVIDNMNVNELVKDFMSYIDLPALLRDLWIYHNVISENTRVGCDNLNLYKSAELRIRRQFVIEPDSSNKVPLTIYIKNGVVTTNKSVVNHEKIEHKTEPAVNVSNSMQMSISERLSAPVGFPMGSIGNNINKKKRTREEIMNEISNNYKIKRGGG